MPLQEDELRTCLAAANESLLAIQIAYGRENAPEARIRFPRGWIRTAATLRQTLPNMGTPLERRNASYALLGLEPMRWLAVRTDISNAALSMIVKQMIAILGSLLEWFVRVPTRDRRGRHSFNKRSQMLVALGIFDEEQKAEIDWVWSKRSVGLHLHLPIALEHEGYTRADWNRAAAAYVSARKSLVDLHGSAP